jgi:hypothetical protein
VVTVGEILDGDQWWLDPGDDFNSTDQALIGVEELDEELDDPWESALSPVFRDLVPAGDSIEQGWGSFSVCLTAFCAIVGIQKDQYQHNNSEGKAFSVMAKNGIEERI